MRKFLLLPVFILMSVPALAVGEVLIQDIKLEQVPPFRYKVSGTIINEMPDAREVVLRAQVVMYDETAPKGDLPVRVLRKDMTVVLKGSETRTVEMMVTLEGRMPDVRFRAEPVLRIRRQRPWIFPYEDLNEKYKNQKK